MHSSVLPMSYRVLGCIQGVCRARVMPGIPDALVKGRVDKVMLRKANFSQVFVGRLVCTLVSFAKEFLGTRIFCSLTLFSC